MGVAGGTKPVVSPALATGASPPETKDAGLAAIDTQPCAGAAINALGTGTCNAMKLDGTALAACTRPAQLEKFLTDITSAPLLAIVALNIV